MERYWILGCEAYFNGTAQRKILPKKWRHIKLLGPKASKSEIRGEKVLQERNGALLGVWHSRDVGSGRCNAQTLHERHGSEIRVLGF